MSTSVGIFGRAGLLITATVSVAVLEAQPSVQVTSPTNGAQVSPGQSLTVTVNASGVSTVLVAIESLGWASISAPPYQASIAIPAAAAPRMYTLSVAGYGTPGQNQSPVFAQLRIKVERPDAPTSLGVWPPSPNLDVGDVVFLHVTGTYSDSSTADISQAPSTTYVSSDPAVATVSPAGTVAAVAPGSTVITVNGILQVPVTVLPPMKIAPLQKALYAGQSQQFYPTLADGSSPSVSWILNPPGAGSISGSGLYTAPSSIAAQQIVTVTATSGTISATASVTLLPPLALNLAPAAVNLNASQSAHGLRLGSVVRTPGWNEPSRRHARLHGTRATGRQGRFSA